MKICRKCKIGIQEIFYESETVVDQWPYTMLNDPVLEKECQFWAHVALRALEKAFEAYREMNDDKGREIGDRI